MKSLKKQRRIQILILASVALIGATVLIGYGFRDGINLFRAPSQVLADLPEPAEVFRLGGLVKDGSLVKTEGATITFVVTDGPAEIPVIYTGILPDLFGEGTGVVATGNYIDRTFQATEILAKHDENYMPAEVIDALKQQGTYVAPTN
jgi:cytochrome c-type biogenesis protein CcmE